MRVARSGQHFRHAVAHLDDGNVERAAAQVVHHDFLVVFLIHAIGKGRGRGLVDDALYIQARNGAGVLRGLALGIVEIGRHRDDSLCHLFAQVAFGVRFQLGKDHGADFLRGVFLAVNLYLVVGAHLALDRGDGAVRVCDGLAFCHLAHQALARLGKAHHARRGARAFGVGDHHGLAALHHGNAAVCSAKVDTNDLTHNSLLPFSQIGLCGNDKLPAKEDRKIFD